MSDRNKTSSGIDLKKHSAASGAVSEVGGDHKKMVSIWTWVGMVLATYGAIITCSGIYYVFVPETQTATAALNPSLWWGAFMVVAGVVFLLIGRKARESA